MSLSGHLLIDFPISVGAVTMMSGQVNFRMSDHGFYFLFGGDALVPVVGTIGVCVLVGHHDTVTPAMQTTLAEYAHNGQFPAAFNDGFSGFLINGRWEPVNESASVTIPIVPGLADITVAAYAQLGIEVRIAADFGEDYFMFSALGYGNAGVYFGLDVVLCTIGFYVEVGLELLAKAEIHGDQVSFEGCASVSMGVIFDACIDTACWNGSISMNFEMNSASGIDAGISLDNCTSSGDELSLVKGSGADAVCD